MQQFRRLSPLLRALGLLGLVLLVASLGVSTWMLVLFREHQGLSATPWQIVGPAFLALALACNWPGVAYGFRFRLPARALPWLDTWRGQLAATVGLAVLPLGSVAAALLIPPDSLFFALAFLLDMLALLVLLAAYVWALVLFVA